MFSLICASVNAWVNNLETGDLRRYHARYDVSVTKAPYIHQNNCCISPIICVVSTVPADGNVPFYFFFFFFFCVCVCVCVCVCGGGGGGYTSRQRNPMMVKFKPSTRRTDFRWLHQSTIATYADHVTFLLRIYVDFDCMLQYVLIHLFVSTFCFIRYYSPGNCNHFVATSLTSPKCTRSFIHFSLSSCAITF